MIMGKRRIAASYVYTLESEAPILNGYIEFDENDGTILEVGECKDPSAEEFYEGALVPGFVNAHCHVELSHLHKKFRKGTGMAGFIDQINELRDWAGREKKAELVKVWMDKMWEDGVSAMADISNDDSSFEVKASHKMYTRTFLEVFGSEPHMCDGVMADVTELHKVASENGLDAAQYTFFITFLAASISSCFKHTLCTSNMCWPYGAGAASARRSIKYLSEDSPVTGGVLMLLRTRFSYMAPLPLISRSSSS